MELEERIENEKDGERRRRTTGNRLRTRMRKNRAMTAR